MDKSRQDERAKLLRNGDLQLSSETKEIIAKRTALSIFKELDRIFESGYDKSIFRQYLALKKQFKVD